MDFDKEDLNENIPPRIQLNESGTDLQLDDSLESDLDYEPEPDDSESDSDTSDKGVSAKDCPFPNIIGSGDASKGTKKRKEKKRRQTNKNEAPDVKKKVVGTTKKEIDILRNKDPNVRCAICNVGTSARWYNFGLPRYSKVTKFHYLQCSKCYQKKKESSAMYIEEDVTFIARKKLIEQKQQEIEISLAEKIVHQLLTEMTDLEIIKLQKAIGSSGERTECVTLSTHHTKHLMVGKSINHKLLVL